MNPISIVEPRELSRSLNRKFYLDSVLVIDNYDSFTYNIAQYFQMLGSIVHVVKNDSCIDDLEPSHLVIGPGPGTPKDSGISKNLMFKALGEIPILGVCLGHQCIGEFFGGTVLRAKKPMHGKVSAIYHDGQGIFQGMKYPFHATRYHSLIVEKNTLPKELIITAETDEGEIMGLRHRDHQLEGIQFHPESVLTEDGLLIFQNFLNLKSKEIHSC
jgi:anthranilate synthase/aminodeoxychorismate synthase-like glutamine amidotransferase